MLALMGGLGGLLWVRAVGAWLFVGGASVTLALGALHSGGEHSAWFSVDALGGVLVLLCVWLLLSSGLAGVPSGGGVWVGALVLVLVAAFSVESWLWFFVLFEASVLPVFVLVLRWGGQPERFEAGAYLLLYTVAASLPLLVALLGMVARGGHISLHLSAWAPPGWALGAGGGALLLAFLVKLPVYGCHLWLPKAHVEAPLVGSMMLAGAMLKLGAYGIARTVEKVDSAHSLGGLWGVFLWGALLSAVACFSSADVKQWVAYSSVMHMGLVAAALLSGGSWGLWGAGVMMVAHGLGSPGLFAWAGVVYGLTGSRGLATTKGLCVGTPALAFGGAALLSSNFGVPPTFGGVGEMAMLVGVAAASVAALLPLALVVWAAAGVSLGVLAATCLGGRKTVRVGASPYIRSFMGPLVLGVPMLVLFLGSEHALVV